MTISIADSKWAALNYSYYTNCSVTSRDSRLSKYRSKHIFTRKGSDWNSVGATLRGFWTKTVWLFTVEFQKICFDLYLNKIRNFHGPWGSLKGQNMFIDFGFWTGAWTSVTPLIISEEMSRRLHVNHSLETIPWAHKKRPCLSHFNEH